MMAFGAVATGNIKAHDAEIVAGIIKILGSKSDDKAVCAKMGNSNKVDAVLLVTSVRNVTHKQIHKMSKKG